MLPSPTTPSTLLQTSVPVNASRRHSPALSEAAACGMLRASASSMETVCSAVVTLLPPGVFMTTIPRCEAAATSMLSTPMPARPMTRRPCAASITSGVTRVPLRTINPWYAPMQAVKSASLSPGRNSKAMSG